jgi:chromosome segregation ATPase
VVHDWGATEIQRDTCNEETFDLLRAEIEHLQFAVAERDAQLAEALAATHEPETPLDGTSVKQLMERLEALLDELDRSDERMGTLEELLRVTEEANRDEREERRQMESWLGDIESVFGEHQATWDAEMTELKNRTVAIAAERDQLLQQLTQPTADDHVEQDAEETAKLRLQVKHLQQRLDEAAATETRQKEELLRRETQLAEATNAENRLREDHLKLAAERASLSRLRAEITAAQAESQKVLQDTQADTDIDSRVRGFRQHLREIHDEETQEENAPSLPGRISRLWKRLEAHR